ncbi:MAG TPA: hypothetical protein PKO22_06635 [Treponemataceae bacterium]|nr:hypothetical protein [Treponemataceae bacterium]
MSIENRIAPRYPDFARAKLEDLCPLPGFLEDVSKTGCKVRLSHVLDVDTDREYCLTVLPALRSGIREFELIVKPCWVRAEKDAVEIGFNVLHSPGIKQYNRYVDILAELEEEELQEA